MSILSKTVGQTPLIKSKSTKLESIGPEGGLWKVGWQIRDLLPAVQRYPKDETVTIVFINIGTNGGFNKNDNYLERRPEIYNPQPVSANRLITTYQGIKNEIKAYQAIDIINKFENMFFTFFLIKFKYIRIQISNKFKLFSTYTSSEYL